MIDTNGDTEDDMTSEDEAFICDGCGSTIDGIPGTTKWFRCTKCRDLDICETCHQNQYHAQHRSQINTFWCPSQDDPWCDSCGTFQSNDNNVLYKCQICPDYLLCSLCKQHRYHKKHGMVKTFACTGYTSEVF